MHTIEINPDDPRSIRAALETEWLLTNGLGGYAMGTVLGVNTRRYHGLLVAATKPPVGRVVALHSMIEQLILSREDGTEEVIDLSTQQFVGADGAPMLHPDGWRRLRSFSCNRRTCIWSYQLGDFLVRKSIAPNPNGFENDVTLRYELLGNKAQAATLRVRPLIPLRNLHSLDSSPVNPAVTVQGGGVGIERSGLRLHLLCSSPFRKPPQLWQRFAYSRDRERGLDWVENVWSPGEFSCEVAKGTEALLHISAIVPFAGPFERPSSISQPPDTEDELHVLSGAAGQFLVVRGLDSEVHQSIIAGYPWFSDWGRDTMIALPGLLLCTGRVDEARGVLLTFARHMRNGLIPNLFDESGASHYNTVDASLWFVHAVRDWWRATKSPPPFREGAGGWVGRAAYRSAAGGSMPYPPPNPLPQGRGESPIDADLLAACRAVFAAYRGGTDFKIRMDDDGLIAAGDAQTQLTWMDAKRDGVVFTPRHGKAVEINALWFNALHALAEMTDDDAERRELIALARKVETSFRDAFRWHERGCLHDCLSPAVGESREAASVRGGVGGAFVPDGKLRPNQIFAVSLPFSPLTRAQQRSVVDVVGERLLTPFGLRTLDRDDPGYRGRFEGDLFQRDAAYHNGTVWPWLMGAYCEALLRVNDFSEEAKAKVRALLQPLIDEMSSLAGGRCLGQIAEVYDGDEPQRPGGCPAQAWSVAEVLRLMSMVTR